MNRPPTLPPPPAAHGRHRPQVPGARGAAAARRLRLAPRVRLALTAATLGALAVPAVGTLAAPGAHAAACGPWMDASRSPDQRAHDLLAVMPLSEKITLVHQADYVDQYYGTAGYVPPDPSLCIPALVLNDAGAGVGDAQSATTAFPAPIAQSATWDPDLQRAIGRAIGSEAARKGIDVQLAPGVDIARTPLNGRTFEYMGEDPFLAGQGAAAEIRGIQDNPVIATVKHYAANDQETNRMSVSADVDERTMHEIELPAFEAAVRQGRVGSVMCSYNRLGGTYACENPTLLTRDLKQEMGFDGFVMSDWGATHSTVASADAGLDMEMDVRPGTYYGSALQSAVQSGRVAASRLDDMVLRILRPMFREGLFEHPPASEPGAYAGDAETPADVALARLASEEGTVMLKNRQALLPITGTARRIAVIGRAASPAVAELAYGGQGSSHVPEAGGKPDIVSPLQGITQRAVRDGDVVTYADGGVTADAVAAATAADVAVVVVNTVMSEGRDLPDLTLEAPWCALFGCASVPYDQDALIAAVAAANPHTVVVLDTGSPVVMPWLDQVGGVLEAWYPGQEDGDALAALLFGDADPSGRLPITFPRSQSDLPTRTPQQYPGVNGHALYTEGLDVGYRWYDDRGIQPLFPFGFGLSYTTFAYSHLSVAPGAPGGSATVSFDVTNTGARAGAEVAQVYIGAPIANATHEPPRQLRGSRRVDLQPGRTVRVDIPIDARAVSSWDATRRAWVAQPGCHPVLVGASSRDVRLLAPGLDAGLGVCGSAVAASTTAPAPAETAPSAAPPVATPNTAAAAGGPRAATPLVAIAAVLAAAAGRRRRRRSR